MNDTTEKRGKGRPASKFTQEYITDIAHQTLVYDYNCRPEVLLAKFRENRHFHLTLPTHAHKYSAFVRRVLEAEELVSIPFPDCIVEVSYRVYLASLEGSPSLLQKSLKTKEHVFRENSTVFHRPVRQILEARDRVNRKEYLHLENPFITKDEDDEF